MCFEFGCFGGATREDYGGERSSARKPPQSHGRGRRGNRRNDDDYGGAGDHKAPPAAYRAATVDEPGHKAYHDGARKDHHADGRYIAYVLDKVDYDTPKLPAWHNKVGDDTGYGYTYTARPEEDEAAAGPRRAMAYHHYPTTTATISYHGSSSIPPSPRSLPLLLLYSTSAFLLSIS